MICCGSHGVRAETLPPLRFGITPAVLQDQRRFLEDWSAYLTTRLGRPVTLVSRDRYSETLEMLKLGALDFAWLSDYPYIVARPQVRLLAVPVYRGKPRYGAYLIVPATDSQTSGFDQLRGTVFAYSDPLSHTGHLIPRYELARRGVKAAEHFRLTFFTWSHRNLVQAVARGLADGAYVDSYIWDSMEKLTPDITRRTRIVERSAEFAFPPIAVRRGVGKDAEMAFRQALLAMNRDAEGKRLLGLLNLDGFTEGSDALYDPVADMMRAVGDR